MKGKYSIRVFLSFLLVCSVIARKHSSLARVAFLNFVSENEHEAKNEKIISPSQFSNAIKRVMSLDATVESNMKLPEGDLFNKPNSNVVLFIDGIGPGPWDKAMPFLREVFHKAPTFMISQSSNSHESIIHECLEDTNLEDFSKIICDSSNEHLFEADACNESEQSEFESSQNYLKIFDLEAKASKEKMWTIFSEKNKKIQNVKINSHLLYELTMISNLSNVLNSRDNSEKPEFYVLHLTSLIKTEGNFGEENSMKFSSGLLIDHSIQSLVKSLPTATSVQIVMGDHLSTKSKKQKPHRRLQTTNTTVSLDDIKQFQLNLWTGVFLALMVFMAIFGIVTMDIGRDSLLYAKFQADTSGKND